MRPDVFWDLSVAEVNMAIEAHAEREKSAWRRTLSIVNVQLAKKDRIRLPEDEAEEAEEVPTFLDKDSFDRYMSERIARAQAKDIESDDV